jgi:3-isopropylmalate dehydrogenase
MALPGRDITKQLALHQPQRVLAAARLQSTCETPGPAPCRRRVAFELAKKRGNKVTSADKRNVMKSGVLWNQVMTALHKREYPDVKLEHQLADALGMQLVRWPKQFDVIVTDNLFGDMLSDAAAMLTGSLGMLPSASLGDADPKTGKRRALYEPVHGSVPDIAGKGLANPIAMIGSFGIALRYSFGLDEAADRLEAAIAEVLAEGLRTADIKSEGCRVVSTSEMGDAIVADPLARYRDQGCRPGQPPSFS